MLLLAQLCMFTLLEEWLPQETTLDSGLEKKGVSARVMTQHHSLVGCAALPGLKLLWGACKRRRGYDDGLVVREYPFDGEDAASPQRIATHHRDHVDASSTEFHGDPQS